MKGYRLVALSSQGEDCLKSYYNDLGKKSLAKMWKAVRVNDDPYSLSVMPASKFYAMALSVSDSDMILSRVEKLFSDEFNVIRNTDYDMEVLEDDE